MRCEVDECEMELSASDPWVGLCFKHRMDAEQTESGCRVEGCWKPATAPLGFCEEHRTDTRQTNVGCDAVGCSWPRGPDISLCQKHQRELEATVDARQANDRQEGGDHYKQLSPEPWDVIDCWGLDYFTGNALKYIARASLSGMSEPLVQDLRKAVHYLEKAIERERPAPEPPAPEPGPDWDHASALHGGVSLAEELREGGAYCPGCGSREGQKHLHSCAMKDFFAEAAIPEPAPGRIVNAKAVVRPRKPE